MAGTMRGLWLENKQLSLRKNLLIPDVVTGEALIRVRLAGICSTDLEMLNGLIGMSYSETLIKRMIGRSLIYWS